MAHRPRCASLKSGYGEMHLSWERSVRLHRLGTLPVLLDETRSLGEAATVATKDCLDSNGKTVM